MILCIIGLLFMVNIAITSMMCVYTENTYYFEFDYSKEYYTFLMFFTWPFVLYKIIDPRKVISTDIPNFVKEVKKFICSFDRKKDE